MTTIFNNAFTENKKHTKSLWTGIFPKIEFRDDHRHNNQQFVIIRNITIHEILYDDEHRLYVKGLDTDLDEEFIFDPQSGEAEVFRYQGEYLTLPAWCRQYAGCNPVTLLAAPELRLILNSITPEYIAQFDALLAKLDNASAHESQITNITFQYRTNIGIEFQFAMFLMENELAVDLTDDFGENKFITILDQKIPDFDDYILTEIDYDPEYSQDPDWETYTRILNRELSTYKVTVVRFYDGCSGFIVFPVDNEKLESIISISSNVFELDVYR